MPGTILPFRGITPKIHEDAFIAETAVIIGDVEVGAGSSVWCGCVLRGEVNRIRVGSGTNLQDGTIVHVNHDRAGDYRQTGGGMPTTIGDNVTVGHQALIHACTVESGAFIGMAAVIMDGAVVEGQAMVAAGALVTPGKRVGARQLWGGRPAKPMRALTEDELAGLPYLSDHYQGTAASYLEERRG